MHRHAFLKGYFALTDLRLCEVLTNSQCIITIRFLAAHPQLGEPETKVVESIDTSISLYISSLKNDTISVNYSIEYIKAYKNDLSACLRPQFSSVFIVLPEIWLAAKPASAQ